MERLNVECAEPQIRSISWAMERGWSLENLPSFPIRSGGTAYLFKTLGLNDCPPVRVLLSHEPAGKILLHDVDFSYNGSRLN